MALPGGDYVGRLKLRPTIAASSDDGAGKASGAAGDTSAAALSYRLTPFENLVCSLVASMTAEFVTYPAEVAKVRLQISGEPG